jgi:hypothetical protein
LVDLNDTLAVDCLGCRRCTHVSALDDRDRPGLKIDIAPNQSESLGWRHASVKLPCHQWIKEKTFLNILANDPVPFFCGEQIGLRFRPARPL